jgi:glycosyltransferase involved in cell wall biosynthesis
LDAIFTIVSNNYLHYARTLLKSAKHFHPEADLYCFIVDREMDFSNEITSEFKSINIISLPIPDIQDFIFQYTILELNTAIKPWAIEHLLVLGKNTVCYIDPDICLYSRLEMVEEALCSNADIVLTPHLLAPIDDAKIPTELDIKKTGTYNLGFIGVKDSQNTRSFIRWWQGKLQHDCIVDIKNGIFVDQSWVDLVPALFSKTYILRDPGYNVAYWNIAQRKIQKRDDKYLVNGRPLAFFHYSGFDYTRPGDFSKHQNRFSLNSLDESTRTLVLDYSNRLRLNGGDRYKKLAYTYAKYDDGFMISDFVRSLYRSDLRLQEEYRGKPFSSSEMLFRPAVLGHPALQKITIAMYATWMGRDDLQKVFNLNDIASAIRFLEWFIAEGENYYDVQVVDRHRSLLTLLGDTKTREQDLIVYSKSASFLNRLYFTALKRNVDPSGFDVYSPNCSTRTGRMKTFRSVIRSGESRALPYYFIRYIKSYLLAANSSGNKISSLHALNYNQSISECKHGDINEVTETFVNFSGLYEGDQDFLAAGFWISPKFTINIPHNYAGGTISIEGNAFEDLWRKAEQSTPTLLTILLDGRIFKQTPIGGDSEFAIRTEIPDFDKLLCSITIEVSSSFVPKNIQLGEDARILSWRCRKISINEESIVDCVTSPYIFYEPLLPTLAGVNLVGYVTSEHGVGKVSRLLSNALNSADVLYSAIDVGHQVDTPKKHLEIYNTTTTKSFPIDIFCVNADMSISVVDYLIDKGHKSICRIGFWHWEQTELPPVMQKAYGYFDEIWAPSSFVQDAIAKSSPIPVFKIPHAIQLQEVTRKNCDAFNLPRDKFLTLISYDFDSFQDRKNPLGAIEAYRRATENRADCALILKTTNAHKYPDDTRRLNLALNGINNVFIFDAFLSELDLQKLQNCCDCLISLHRSEGFGLNLAEMMALGKPVIATGWSGNMEFMTPMNSLLVNYELHPLDRDIGPYCKGLEWATPDILHAAALLRKLIGNKTLCASLGMRARSDIAGILSPEKVGLRVKKRLELVLSRKIALGIKDER